MQTFIHKVFEYLKYKNDLAGLKYYSRYCIDTENYHTFSWVPIQEIRYIFWHSKVYCQLL